MYECIMAQLTVLSQVFVSTGKFIILCARVQVHAAIFVKSDLFLFWMAFYGLPCSSFSCQLGSLS